MMNGIWAAGLMAVLSAGLCRAEPTNGHEFVCGDYVQNKIMVIGRDGQVKWEYLDLRKPQGCPDRDLRADALGRGGESPAMMVRRNDRTMTAS